jgi:molecular chaperone DnaJ
MITVPSATESGTKLRLKGQGEAGPPGAPPGDLIVTFKVQPDRFFRRDGLDILCEVPINMVQATLGTRLKVRTLVGKKVILRIPPGTQPGRKFRIKGQGITKHGRTGDQLVEIAVSLPEKLSAEAEDALKVFAERAGIAN